MRRLLFILMCLSLVSLSQATIVKVEAEDSSLYYVDGNWSTQTDPEASGGQYITAIINGTSYNEAYTRYYTFDVPAGTYSLYMRINMSSDGGIAVNDSFYHSDSSFAEDAAMREQNNTAGTGIDGVSTTDNWGWILIDDGFVSSGGSVIFKLSTREDGCGIDTIAFVTADETVTDEFLNSNPLAPYDPVVTPENIDGSVGTLNFENNEYTVDDVVLSFKAGKDPAETYAVNPDIIKHNIWLQKDLPSDPNMFLIDTLMQTSLDDPNQSTGPLNSLVPPVSLADNTTFQWWVEQVLEGYGDGDPNNIWGPAWSFKTASAVPVIVSISDERVTEPNGFAYFDIEVTDIADHFQWFEVVGEQDTAENGETNDIKLLDSDSLYEGTTTQKLVVTGAASDGSDDAQVYAIAYNGVPGEQYTEVSDPSPARWFWYPRLVAHYPFETVAGSTTPDVESGYDMTLSSGDAGVDVPSLDMNIPSASGLTTTTSLFFNNPLGADPNANAEYGIINEPTIGRYRDITISAWIYFKGGLFNQRLIDFGEQDNWIYITPQSDGNVLLMDVIGQTVTAPSIPNNEWTHITATLRGDTGRLFVNGQWVGSGEITNNPIDIGTSGMHNYVGRSNNPDDAYLNGYIDDLKIFNYGLTNEDVAQLYMDDTLEPYLCELELYDLEDFDINENCVLDMTDLLGLIARWLEDDRIYPAP